MLHLICKATWFQRAHTGLYILHIQLGSFSNLQVEICWSMASNSDCTITPDPDIIGIGVRASVVHCERLLPVLGWILKMVNDESLDPSLPLYSSNIRTYPNLLHPIGQVSESSRVHNRYYWLSALHYHHCKHGDRGAGLVPCLMHLQSFESGWRHYSCEGKASRWRSANKSHYAASACPLLRRSGIHRVRVGQVSIVRTQQCMQQPGRIRSHVCKCPRYEFSCSVDFCSFTHCTPCRLCSWTARLGIGTSQPAHPSDHTQHSGLQRPRSIFLELTRIYLDLHILHCHARTDHQTKQARPRLRHVDLWSDPRHEPTHRTHPRIVFGASWKVGSGFISTGAINN